MVKLQNNFKKGREFILFERGKTQANKNPEGKEDKKEHILSGYGDGDGDETEIKKDQKYKKSDRNTEYSEMAENRKYNKEKQGGNVILDKEVKENQKDRNNREVAKNNKDRKKAKHMAKLQNSIKKGKELVILEKSKLFKKKSKNTKEEKQLDRLAKMTENRLFMMSTVWPFDLFRNRVYIEEKQVILVFKQFFFITQEYNILIQDILVPVVENSLLFSTLKIQMGPGGFQQDPPPVRFLPKNDVLKAKNIIMGLLVCHKEEIKLDDLEKEELLEKLIEIGRFRTD